SDEARWGEPLRDGVERTLRGDLAARLGDERVLRAPSEGARPSDLVVDVEVRRFEAVAPSGAPPSVELEATWTVREAGSGRVLAESSSAYAWRPKRSCSRAVLCAVMAASASGVHERPAASSTRLACDTGDAISSS